MLDKTAVLVVEDEPLIRMDVVDQLADEGFHIFEASNADEAIDILDSNPTISLLITDIDMPGSMDGLKLAAAVRRRWPPVKIIVTSRHRIIDVTELPDGSMFFAKPYQHNTVVPAIRDMLSNSLPAGTRH